MTGDSYFDSVKDHFLYLTEEFGFKVVREMTYPHFDFADVVFGADDYLVKVSREKGYVMVDISLVSSPEYWVDLPAMMEFMTKEVDRETSKNPATDDSDAGIDRQVKRWAGILKPWCRQIGELTRNASQWVELRMFLEERNRKWFEERSSRT